MSILKLVLIVWAWTYGVLAQSDELPKAGEKPGNPNAATTLLACMNATNTLLKIPEVYQSLVKLSGDAYTQMQTEGGQSCETKGQTTVCTFDYSKVSSDFQSLCESNGGVYDENEQQVTCDSPNDPTVTGTLIVRYTNYPSCFSSSCQSGDIERWISNGVEQFENDVEQSTDLICDSQYQMENTVTEAPMALSSGTTTSMRPNTQGQIMTLSLTLLVSAFLGVTW